jgi:hypothetical protein
MELRDLLADAREAVPLEAAHHGVVRACVGMDVGVLAEPEERQAELLVEEEDPAFDVGDAFIGQRLPVRALERLDARTRRDAASLEQRVISSSLRVLLERASKGG